MIDLTVVPDALERAVKRAKEKSIIIPTLKQQRDPARIPDAIVSRLKNIGLWDIDPSNLFRITWHNEPVARGGGFGDVNFIEFPGALTGVEEVGRGTAARTMSRGSCDACHGNARPQLY